MKRAKTIIKDAAVLLDERGWTQGFMQDRQTKEVCAVGAMRLAAFGDVHAVPRTWFDGFNGYDKARRHVAYHLRSRSRTVAARTEQDDTGKITWWNDQVATSKEQVISLLLEVSECNEKHRD